MGYIFNNMQRAIYVEDVFKQKGADAAYQSIRMEARNFLLNGTSVDLNLSAPVPGKSNFDSAARKIFSVGHVKTFSLLKENKTEIKMFLESGVIIFDKKIAEERGEKFIHFKYANNSSIDNHLSEIEMLIKVDLQNLEDEQKEREKEKQKYEIQFIGEEELQNMISNK